jgi:hypothetical protein
MAGLGDSSHGSAGLERAESMAASSSSSTASSRILGLNQRRTTSLTIAEHTSPGGALVAGGQLSPGIHTPSSRASLVGSVHLLTTPPLLSGSPGSAVGHGGSSSSRSSDRASNSSLDGLMGVLGPGLSGGGPFVPSATASPSPALIHAQEREATHGQIYNEVRSLSHAQDAEATPIATVVTAVSPVIPAFSQRAHALLDTPAPNSSAAQGR